MFACNIGGVHVHFCNVRVCNIGGSACSHVISEECMFTFAMFACVISGGCNILASRDNLWPIIVVVAAVAAAAAAVVIIFAAAAAAASAAAASAAAG